MLNEGPCMHCRLEKPIFRHNVYYNNNALQICTSCLLKMYYGAFCSICFKVYDIEDFNSDSKLVYCCLCLAKVHFNCIHNLASTSNSITTSPYICPSCYDPNFKFFNCQRDEKTQSVCIDKHLADQLLAAAIISQRSMKEGVILCRKRVEIKATEAAEARKKAKKALERLEELNMQKRGNKSSSAIPSKTNGEKSG